MATQSAERRRTALITGASSGIGRDYAYYLCAHQFDLVICARRTAKLNALAKKLRKAFGGQVTVIHADLAKTDAAKKLAAEIKRQRIQIDYLVNNAGYSTLGDFDKSTWRKHQQKIQLMASTLTQLCHIFAPQMARRGDGRIVNIASVAAYVPSSSGDTLYPAIKAYVVRFSQSLYLQYKKSGVHVVAVCPGYTYSEFHDANGSRQQVSRLPDFLWLEGPRVVRDAHRAVEAGKGPVIINGMIYRALTVLTRLASENFFLRIFGAQRHLNLQQAAKKAKPKTSAAKRES